MGNCISCKVLTSTSLQTTNSKVILPHREIKKIQHRTKAAELMMEAPNFFIFNAKSLKIGQRFLPLAADDDIETHSKVYAMFPMNRKNSFFNTIDLGGLFLTANSILKRSSSSFTGNTVRVLRKFRIESVAGVASPEIEESNQVEVPRLSLEGVEEVSTPEFKYRMSMSRSRKPLLETILEEHYSCLR